MPVRRGQMAVGRPAGPRWTGQATADSDPASASCVAAAAAAGVRYLPGFFSVAGGGGVANGNIGSVPTTMQPTMMLVLSPPLYCS